MTEPAPRLLWQNITACFKKLDSFGVREGA